MSGQLDVASELIEDHKVAQMSPESASAAEFKTDEMGLVGEGLIPVED